MDYLKEYADKLVNADSLKKENEELKRRLAEAQTKPTLTIESAVVQAFRNSPEYMALEMQAFNSFLQEKFLGEFEKSNQAKQFIKVAQERFKAFEENYNKKTKTTPKKEETTDEK